MTQEPSAEFDAGLIEWQISNYERQAARIVQGLRDLADRLEREAVPSQSASVSGIPRFANAAGRVNHELIWGIANIGAHHLFDAAHGADEAERTRVTPPESDDEDDWQCPSCHDIAASPEAHGSCGETTVTPPDQTVETDATDPRECGWMGCGHPRCSRSCEGVPLDEWRAWKASVTPPGSGA